VKRNCGHFETYMEIRHLLADIHIAIDLQTVLDPAKSEQSTKPSTVESTVVMHLLVLILKWALLLDLNSIDTPENITLRLIMGRAFLMRSAL
jgi:hypothetical protein